MRQNTITTAKHQLKQMFDDMGKKKITISDISKETTVVSFDVFDTLLIRDVSKPTDVFSLMEHNNGISGFQGKRIEAEKKARISSSEVNITDIYRSFEGISEDTLSLYVEKEFQAELSLCHPNPEMISFYNECLKKYKVIIISDMYWPEDRIKTLLNECGISGYSKLYISCDYGSSKGENGDLYDLVTKDLGIDAKNITHIGNDFISDYLNAKKKGLNVLKTRTKQVNRLICNEKRLIKDVKTELIYNFINNTSPTNADFYYRFGYENFGILLWGFCKWLVDRMATDGIEQVLFVARDGYIIKKVYDLMRYSELIPSFYFEMSRRSVVVPSSFSQEHSYQEMLALIKIPNIINIRQLFDAWGLDLENYIHIVLSNGVSETESFHCSELSNNKRIERIYEIVSNDILANAKSEIQQALEYVDQFHFERRTAIVDIGWGGTIQKRLIKLLQTHNRPRNIIGYYMALDRRTRDKESSQDFKASGFIWDHFNEYSNETEAMPFVGLFESLFLEHSGSVKKYIHNGNSVIAVRYAYEYLMPGKVVDEIECVTKIQQGALDFIKAAEKSSLNSLSNLSGKQAFFLLRNCLFEPSLEIVNRFKDFRFFDLGDCSYLVRPRMSLFMYLIHFKQLIKDLYKCTWPIGLFKELFRINISYEKLWLHIKKLAGHSSHQ